MMKPGVFKKYAYAWITIGFFLVSFGLHWLFGWYAFADEAAQHSETPELSAYLVEMGRDTFENWQSEFLQLLWQVVGLAYFLYVGSPTSKENDDRMEAKIDRLLELQLGKEAAQQEVGSIDDRFLRHHGHAAPWGHTSDGRE
jgi:hypothetical protein